MGLKLSFLQRGGTSLIDLCPTFRKIKGKARRLSWIFASSQILQLGKSIFVLNGVSWGGLFYPSTPTTNILLIYTVVCISKNLELNLIFINDAQKIFVNKSFSKLKLFITIQAALMAQVQRIHLQCKMQETQVRSLSGPGRSEEGNVNLLQYACLEKCPEEEPGGPQSMRTSTIAIT